ncbi:MAG: glycosyltransferase family A protein [Candidatus Omnitrophota bacterium]
MAKISVVIPTYNREEYLKAAVESVLAQTYGDFEVIVVDDGSTDGTARAASSFGPKVRYILQKNSQVGAARNNGIRNSTGEYIALLDSDDMWSPEHLETCLEAAESAGAGVAYSGSCMVGPEGKAIEKLPAGDFHGDPLFELVAGLSSRGCNASSCLIRKELFGKAGYFSEIRDLSASADWEMWTRLAACARFKFSGKYTAKIRFHTGKCSIDPEGMARSMKIAVDMAFANRDLLPKIGGLKDRAYSNLYVLTAINYYAAGRMGEARQHLAEAVRKYPLSLATNPLLAYTYLRSLLGAGAASAIRKAKWGLGSGARR